MKKTAIFLIALAGTAALFSAQGAGPAAPTFAIQDLDGKAMTSADLKGKVWIVNFWATWCPPCREEIPAFVEFYNAAKAKGLEIIGLSVDTLTPADLKQFVRKNKMTYPVAFASEKIIRDFAPGAYIPTTFIMDKRGRIRHKQVGGVDRATLEKWFKDLSAEN